MKINYNVLKVLNEQALTSSGDQMTCFWTIQSGVEKLLHGETITDMQKKLLFEVGVLEESEDELNRRNIVGPFKFSEDGSTNS
jgi:hypothetical protein